MMKSFTLIEILLVLALIGILAGIAIPIYQSFQVKNDLDVVAFEIAQSLRRSQVLARATDGDRRWGLRIEDQSIYIFRGQSFATRDSDYDEVFSIPESLTPTGIEEVVFKKLTGLPQTEGDIILTSSGNETRTININSKGLISY
jgi:type II secretion system protein H